ncbi:MAG TPA: hypothetical protein VEZ17_05525 [Chitinophagaceae bacterium]|jgi:hypothetical protein|nr:hypothetical protein [Chitinophagaceae bacterium]
MTPQKQPAVKAFLIVLIMFVLGIASCNDNATTEVTNTDSMTGVDSSLMTQDTTFSVTDTTKD